MFQHENMLLQRYGAGKLVLLLLIVWFSGYNGEEIGKSFASLNGGREIHNFSTSKVVLYFCSSTVIYVQPEVLHVYQHLRATRFAGGKNIE